MFSTGYKPKKMLSPNQLSYTSSNKNCWQNYFAVSSKNQALGTQDTLEKILNNNDF